MTNPFGTVLMPGPIQAIASGPGGIVLLMNAVLRTLVVAAGIYTVINIILAGYGFLAAGGDPKRISDATARIWQSLLGLIIAAGAVVIVGIISQILFGSWQVILNVQLYTP